jgi:hypothetical protein
MSDLQDKIKVDEAQLAADQAELESVESVQVSGEAPADVTGPLGSLELLQIISSAHNASAKAAAQPTFMNLNSAAQASITAAYALLGAGQMEEAAAFTNESQMHERAARSAQQ